MSCLLEFRQSEIYNLKSAISTGGTDLFLMKSKKEAPARYRARFWGGKGHKELSKKRSFGVCLIILGRKDAKNCKNTLNLIKSYS